MTTILILLELGDVNEPMLVVEEVILQEEQVQEQQQLECYQKNQQYHQLCLIAQKQLKPLLADCNVNDNEQFGNEQQALFKEQQYGDNIVAEGFSLCSVDSFWLGADEGFMRGA
jgi:hypothetical protein